MQNNIAFEYRWLIKYRRLIVVTCITALWVCLCSDVSGGEVLVGFDYSRYMSVDEVEPGMTGYGLSVFSGARIEPFAVEVVSVERSMRPGKAVVWVRCTGERMQRIGLVSGMSGSPIYLWDKSTLPDEKVLGNGGRMVGAFAYGYGWGMDAYAGVQPIEQMLCVAQRVGEETGGGVGERGLGQHHVTKTSWRLAKEKQMPKWATWRLEAIMKLLEGEFERDSGGDNGLEVDSSDMRRARVPLMVGSAAYAELLSPFVSNMGLIPMAGGDGIGAGTLAPKWIDAGSVDFEPGGVLSVPLVSGDMDLAAIGTVTEVLRDDAGEIGSVLAFGQSMSGRGKTSVPMGTGYIHFVQPSRRTSFKLGGTLQVRGALVNDETAAVVGSPGVDAVMCPATVNVKWPSASKSRTFSYEIADDPDYTPMMAGYTIVASLLSDTSLPEHCTVLLSSDMSFSGDRKISMNATLPGVTPWELMALVGPMVENLSDNAFEQLKLESVETTVEVQEKVRIAEITNVMVRQDIVVRGDSVMVDVRLKPHRGEAFVKGIEVAVPADLAEGKYGILISGVAMYAMTYISSHPHLMRVKNVDEVFDVMRWIMSIEDNMLYATLIPGESSGMAIGRLELPHLPSSRGALLRVDTSTQATEYVETMVSKAKVDYIVAGEFATTINVISGESDE